MKRWSSMLLAVLVLGAVPSPGKGIPPIPKDAYFIQDYAGIVPAATREKIGRLQQRAFTSNDTPIIVVTIRSMADYGYAGYPIEDFARTWFNNWQIGKKRPDGTLINRGMLLLVSVGDRKARIELGADWGSRADDYAANIMATAIVPPFKEGRFDQGIYNGVFELAELASGGPDQIPMFNIEASIPEILEQVTGPGNVSTSPLPKYAIFAVTALGFILIGLSFVFPSQRKTLLILGIGLIFVAWLFWVFVVILALMAKGKGKSGGGYRSSGGFGSGGFSGGGGASGSW